MLEKILALDTQLFIYLNSLGSERYDGLWLIITKQQYWIPFFLLLFYLIYTKVGIKKMGYILLFVAVLLLITDQITNLFKYTFQRPRPCNNPEINAFIRIVQVRTSFSFFSGHAANTMAVATFLYLIFKKQIKYFWLLFLWPLVFAYSRIYLGLHYPLDILSGYVCGLITGYFMYRVYQFTQIKYFPL
jgi:undecaprenyl-diphosphatase